MKTIYKYTLRFDDEGYAEVEMPGNAEILSVGGQGDPSAPVLWAKVDTSDVMVRCKFKIVGTGHELGHRIETTGKFIGTVNFHPVALVWHIFEVTV